MSNHEQAELINPIRYGSGQPLPEQHKLVAGPLSMLIENGTLKYIKYGEQELIRQIYAAVRNESWGTVLPQFTHMKIQQYKDSFSVHFDAVHKEGAIDFSWQGSIEGEADGTIRYTMGGTANTEFLKNRIGFCILHPIDKAGQSVEVVKPDGQVISGSFPSDISPYQPFRDIQSIRMRLQNVEFELVFEGDIFEMEDQRNWTDASYKTYCTPLDIPYPVKLNQGEEVNQTVIVKVRVQEAKTAREHDTSATNSPPFMQTVHIDNKSIGRLPALGLINTGLLTDWERQHLSKLRLAHLRVELNILQADWIELLMAAHTEAELIGAKLEIEALVGDHGEGCLELLQQLQLNQITPEKLLLFSHSSLISTEAVLNHALQCMEELNWRAKLVGGSRLYYTELNRSPIPLELIEAVQFPATPQVHAFDNESLIETLEVQAIIVSSAKVKSGGLPIAVGPITLHSRINNQGNQPDKDNEPKKTDARQKSLFGAGWTLGSIHQLAESGAEALTYYEITGNGGIMDSRMGLFPVYYIFSEIGELLQNEEHSGAIELLEVTLGNPLKVEGLAIKKGKSLKLMIANLCNETQTIKLDFPRSLVKQLRMLDESSAADATVYPEKFGKRNELKSVEAHASLELTMLPYALCLIDLSILKMQLN